MVIVATIRALGREVKKNLKAENLKALDAGMANLQRHIENVQKFGVVP